MYGIFTYIWLIFMVNVGKYTSPMDPMGLWLLLSMEHIKVHNPYMEIHEWHSPDALSMRDFERALVGTEMFEQSFGLLEVFFCWCKDHYGAES